MILLEIKQYFQKKQQANLEELAAYFQRDPETMRVMLGHWLRKGIIERAPAPTVCRTQCLQCRPEFAEVYTYSNSYRDSTQNEKILKLSRKEV